MQAKRIIALVLEIFITLSSDLFLLNHILNIDRKKFMNCEPAKWRRTSSKTIAECRVFDVRVDECVRDTDDRKANFFVIENPDWVNVLAVTKSGEAVLIQQYRHGSESMILEVPGGMMDDGENAEVAARRELLEETGYSSERWIFLGATHPNPAIQNNRIHHFLALEVEQTQDVNFDDHESILTRLVPLRDIEELVHNGEITHALAITALYFAKRYLENENFTS